MTPDQTRTWDVVYPILLSLLLPVLPVAAADRSPITAEQALDLARKVEVGFLTRDPQPFVDALDDAATVRHSLAGFNLPEEPVRDIASKVKIGRDLGNRILKTLQEGGSYRLVRVDVSGGGTPVPVFRLLQSGSLNYHFWKLERDPAGALRIGDIDIFISGEPLSRTLRRLLIPALAQAARDKAPEVVKLFEEIETMQRVANGGDYATAIDLWKKLPESYRGDKALLLTRLQYAQKLGGSALDEAVKEFERRYPNDPVLDLIRCYALSAARQYDEALAAVERLDKTLQDPFLDVYRAQFHAGKRDFARARPAFERLVKWDPAFERGWGGLLMIALAERDWAETVRLLDRREKATGKALPPSVIESKKEFAEFVRSSEYVKWRAGKGGG